MKPKVAKKTAPPVGRVAFSYIRFSTPEQAAGSSLERQLTAARKWCERNGYALDEKTTFRDLGRSGFTGEHLKDPDAGGLAAFLAMADAGRIPAGAALIVENADRLTRMGARKSFGLIDQIVDRGIRIVILSPYELVLSEDENEAQQFGLFFELMRGHGESARKREFSKGVWQRWKKTGQSKGGNIRPGPVPFWIDRTEHGYQLNKHAGTARLMFSMAGEGWGAGRIRRELKKLEVRPIEKKFSDGTPSEIYIRAVLANPVAYGRCDELDRDDYFPALVSRDEFFRVRAVITDRTREGKRPRERDQVRLLSGLLRHWETGCSYVARKMDLPGGKGRRLFSYFPYSVRTGADDTDTTSFPVHALEVAVLNIIRELDTNKVFGTPTASRVDVLMGEREAVKTQIAELTAELAKPGRGKVAAAVDALATLEASAAELNTRIAEERARLAVPAVESVQLAKRLAAGDLDDTTRVRLRSALHSCVQSIRVAFRSRGVWRMAWGSIQFRDADHTREFVALYRRPLAGIVPEYLWADGQRLQPDAEQSTPDDGFFVLEQAIKDVEEQEGEKKAENRRAYLRERYKRLTPAQREKLRAKGRRRYERLKNSIK